MGRSYIESSRIGWEPGDDRNPSHQDLFLGCLQRMATAMERIADATDEARKHLSRFVRDRDVQRRDEAERVTEEDVVNHRRWIKERFEIHGRLSAPLSALMGQTTALAEAGYVTVRDVVNAPRLEVYSSAGVGESTMRLLDEVFVACGLRWKKMKSSDA